jgi:peptidoglycan hydrolase-like protein with peptidoglycan-binding domain
MEKITQNKGVKSFRILAVFGATPLAIAMALLILPSQVHAAEVTRQLDIGMSGSDVSALQEFYALDNTIYPEGLVTGYYGALTEAATKRFQAKNGLDTAGRVGPLTLAVISAQMGGGVTTVSGGSGGSAPILQSETVRASIGSATFTWMTNKPATARVLYGNSWPFLLSTAPSFVATGGLSAYQSVTASGLKPHTVYYYVLQSTDADGNMNMTLGKPFMTLTSTSTTI